MTRHMTIQIIGADSAFCGNTVALLDVPHVTVANQGTGISGQIEASVTLLCLADVSDVNAIHIAVEMLSSKIVVISRQYSPTIKEWAFSNKASAYFHMPVSQHMLISQLEQISLETDLSTIDDQTIIDFLRGIKQSGVKSIKPVLCNASHYKHWYPLPDQCEIKRYDQIAFLEHLAELGLLSRTLFNRIRICPTCLSEQLNYRELCPRCNSIEIHKQQVVHHFSCGHVAPLSDFSDGHQLLCPKCGISLKHIGADYEKPADYFICSSCAFICPEPIVEFQCFTCDTTGTPDSTREINIYSYEPTEIADQVIASGKLEAIDLETILVNKYTGLYNKEYLIHELQRAVECYKRYELPFSFLLIRVDTFEEVKTNFPDKLQTYVNSIFTTVSKQLRLLDTICVWNSNMLGLVCGGTNAEGAGILAERMCSNAANLEFLYEFAEPRLTICLNECTPEITDYRQLIELTIQEFDDDEKTNN